MALVLNFLYFLTKLHNCNWHKSHNGLASKKESIAWPIITYTYKYTLKVYIFRNTCEFCNVAWRSMYVLLQACFCKQHRLKRWLQLCIMFWRSNEKLKLNSIFETRCLCIVLQVLLWFSLPLIFVNFSFD